MTKFNFSFTENGLESSIIINNRAISSRITCTHIIDTVMLKSMDCFREMQTLRQLDYRNKSKFLENECKLEMHEYKSFIFEAVEQIKTRQIRIRNHYYSSLVSKSRKRPLLDQHIPVYSCTWLWPRLTRDYHKIFSKDKVGRWKSWI